MNKQRQLQRKQAEEQEARRRRLIYIGLGAAVVLILVGLGAFFLQPQAVQGGSAVGAVTCSDIQTVPDLGRAHLQPGQPYNYPNNPPTSGPHDPVPYPPGVYRSPIPVTQEVHSLEHGYVIIHYNGIPADQVQRLGALAQQDSFKLVVSPFPTMPYKVSLTAWDHLQTCDGVDPQVIKNFIGEFRDKGPEQTPM